jgi:hypothetical protein
MKGHLMKILALCLFLILPAAICWAESEAEKPEEQEPTLYDHYHSLKRLQESLANRSLDDQTRLQPQIQRTQRRACERLRKEHREGVSKEEYRRQGGNEFLVFAWQLESFCQARQ